MPYPESKAGEEVCHPLPLRQSTCVRQAAVTPGGHTPNMDSKFTIGESEMSPCHADIMNAEHPLQPCRLHDAPGQEKWPEPAPLRIKLYGDLEDLRRTAAFVRATGIVI